MTPWNDLEGEMRVVPLDANTSDRLLAGVLAPADAPPGYADVARLLEALSAQPTADELARETEHVAMVATAVLSSSGAQFSSPTRSFAPFALSRPRIAAVLIAAGLACTGGIASASAGVLPDTAQDIASAILDKVGISVPDSNAGTRPSVRGASVDRSDGGKGGDISELATTTELTGVDKGATISRVASDGTSRARQRGSGSTATASASEPEPAPVAAPDADGTGTTYTTSEETSDDKSSPGRSTADEASGGHSAAGSRNASTGQEKADKVHKSKQP